MDCAISWEVIKVLYLKFGQLIEYCIRNFPIEKLGKKYAVEASSRPLFSFSK